MTNQPDKTDFQQRNAKNMRAVLIFLGVLNLLMAIIIPLLFLSGSWYPRLGIVLLALLGLWDFSGFRVVRKLGKGDTSF